MTFRRWTVVGWGLMALAVLLAVVSATLVFTSVDRGPIVAMPLRRDILAQPVVHLMGFLGVVVTAVLAGAAFFSGLACFHWAAARRQHHLLEECLRRLPS